MKVLGLLTGRGNNTLKDKNVLDVLGHPVLYYPANAAVKSDLFDDLYCSSDDEKILMEASKCGFGKIKRPPELALPNSQHIDCILHAINYLEEKYNKSYDIVVVLLANNVTIKSSWLKDCIEIMKQGNYSSVIPVVKDNDHHPFRAKRLNEEGCIVSYEIPNQNSNSTNRQDLPENYFLAHNFWVLDVNTLKNRKYGDGPWNFMGKRVKPYVINESIDIHDKLDLIKAAEWIKENYDD